MNTRTKKIVEYTVTIAILGITGIVAIQAAKYFLIRTIIKKDITAKKEVLKLKNVKELYSIYTQLPVEVKDETINEPKGLFSAITSFTQKVKEKQKA